MPVVAPHLSPKSIPLSADWDGRLVLPRKDDAVSKSLFSIFAFSEIPGFSTRKVLCHWFSRGFESYYSSVSPNTAAIRFYQLKSFFRFLECRSEFNSAVAKPKDITSTVCDEYRSWLRHDPKGAKPPKACWQAFCQLLKWNETVDPGSTRDDLILGKWTERVSRRHPNIRPDARVIERQHQDTFHNYCCNLVVRIRKTWEMGEALMKEARSRGISGFYPDNQPPKEDRKDSLKMLSWVTYNLFYPKEKDGGNENDVFGRNRTTDKIREWEIYSLFGLDSIGDLYAMVVPDARTLAPYLWLIAEQTSGSITSILEITTDCLDAPDNDPVQEEYIRALNDGLERISWTKKRSKSAGHRPTMLHRFFQPGLAFGPPRLVRDVLDFTKRMRVHAPRNERQYVFLTNGRQNFWRPCYQLFSSLFRQLAWQAHIPCSPQLSFVRASNISARILDSGLIAGQIEGQHKSIRTTHLHYRSTTVRRKQQLQIGKSLSQFERRITGYSEGSAVDLGAPPEANDRSIAADVARIYLRAFGNPDLYLETRSRRVAYMLQFRRHLLERKHLIHPRRWASLYGPVSDCISSVLSQTKPSILREAIEAPEAPIPFVVE